LSLPIGKGFYRITTTTCFTWSLPIGKGLPRITTPS
jgi:hypothetical protein